MGKKKVTLSIESKVYDEFKNYCDTNAIMLSKKIELYMQDLLKHKKKFLMFFFSFFIALFLMQGVFADVILFEDFEDGDAVGWSITDGLTSGWNISTIEGPIDSFHLIARDTDSETIAERGVNTSGYEDISFSFWWSIDTNNFDTGDYYYAEWYNGTGWTRVLDYTGTPDQDFYIIESNTLPSIASDNENFAIRFLCNVNLGTEGCNLDNITISGTALAGGGDTTFPTFANLTQQPSNATQYVQGQTYEFNVTITDDVALSQTGIEFNGVNYSLSNISDTYSFSISDLGVGEYTYYFWANDSSGNVNVTAMQSYTITQAEGTVALLLNGNADNVNVSYPQATNLSAESAQGSITLYQNGVDITSQNGLNLTRGVDYYNITATYAGNQNYTAASTTFYLNVTQYETTCTLNVFPSTTIVYGTAINVTESCDSGEGVVSLIRKNESILSEVGLNVTLGAGDYSIVLNVTATQNYTFAQDNLTLTVLQASNDITLLLNGVSDNLTLEVGTPLNVTASTAHGTLSVERNGSNVLTELGTNQTLPVGEYNYTAFTTGNQNYSATSITYFVTVENTTVVNATPQVASVNTLVAGSIAPPTYNDTFIIQVNASDADNDTLQTFVTLIAPNGTIVLDDASTAEYSDGTNTLFNSTELLASAYGIWNYSYRVTDGTSNTTGSGSFEIYSDLQVFPAVYAVTPDPKNETLQYDVSMYHQSPETYEYSFSYELNATYFTLTFTNTYANLTTNQYNASNVFVNPVTITTSNDVLEDTLYEGTITITRLFDGTNYTVPIEIGVDTPVGEIDALNSSGGACHATECDYDISMENDEEQVLTWTLGNTGNNTLTACYPNVTGFDYSPFGVFSQENFSIPIGNTTTLTLTLDEPSINTFYGQLEVICQSTSLGYQTALSADSANVPEMKILVTADSGSPTPPSSSSSGGGGGGGGGGASPGVLSGIFGGVELEFPEIPSLSFPRGGSDIIPLPVLNVGTRFLNGCSLDFVGDIAPWLASVQTESISSGQQLEFIFTVNVPFDAPAGISNGELIVTCDEGEERVPLSITVESSLFEVLIQNAERQGIDLLVEYVAQDFSGSEQELIITYSLINAFGATTTQGTEVIIIGANEELPATLAFELPQNSIGEFTLQFAVSNGQDEQVVNYPVALSLQPGLTGFAVSEGNQRAIITGLVVILALLSLYFALKFLNNHYNRTHPHPEATVGRKLIPLDQKTLFDGQLSEVQTVVRDETKWKKLTYSHLPQSHAVKPAGTASKLKPANLKPRTHTKKLPTSPKHHGKKRKK